MNTAQEQPIVTEDQPLETNELTGTEAQSELEASAILTESDLHQTITVLEQELLSAQQKAEESWNKMLRIQAEMDNLKRRTQKDLEDARKYAIEKFAKELISVIDSLELGLQAISSDHSEVQKFREGNELTLKQFSSVFSKFNIEILNPLGQAFNPEFHQAMAMQVSTEVAANTVLTVFQKGYTLNGRLLRPAMVVVAKAAAA
ncbi:MAG: nucleotide exchange factor GrpE [Pseudomonadota bacterium]|jgi:molecular chaperone GrpE